LPVFLGDDVTDEDGFRAVTALKGAGVLIGAERPTAATWRLDGVAQVRAWLTNALKELA
jgi:trehalose 6-phosphate phosphatase